MTRATSAGLLALPLLLVTLASSSPVPGGVDWSTLCDHHTKQCPDIDVEDLGGVSAHGLVLVQPLPSLSYFLPPPGGAGPAQASHPGGDHPGQGDSPSSGNGHKNGHGGQDSLLSAEAEAEASLPGVSLSAYVGASVGADEPEAPELPATEPSTPPEQVPCSDPRGCPDLLVDATKLRVGGFVTQTFAEDNCNVLEGSTQPGQRRLLRFTFTTPNLGMGDLVVGNPFDLGEQWFDWGDCHGHWHFREYADYRLWTVEGFALWQATRAQDPTAMAAEVLADHPELEEHFVAGHKQGFCVIDIDWYDPLAGSRYRSCLDQGISRGWADQYHYTLDGQFIDVTGLEPGFYVLEAEVNAERLFEEIDYANNAGALLVVVQ